MVGILGFIVVGYKFQWQGVDYVRPSKVIVVFAACDAFVG